MRFDNIIPVEPLKPYIRHFTIAEQPHEQVYRVFPSTSMVIGFQYKGRLRAGQAGTQTSLATAGISGVAD